MNHKHLKRGKFLLSEPSMQDKNFKRTVLLITEHNENESIGFIINRPTKYKVSEIIEDFPQFSSPIYVGGPVETNTLHFIHSLGDRIEQSIPISHGLYWSGNFETVKSLIKQRKVNESEIKFFLGYSGWSAGQLEYELQENAWILTNTKSNIALEKSDNKLWQKLVKTLDKDYAIWHNMPDDPELN